MSDKDTTFIDHITEKQVQQLKEAAATISGQTASELTLDEAVQIMKHKGFKMPNLAAMNAAFILWANLSLEQLKRILAAADPGETEAAILSAIEEIAQDAQEDTAGQEAQEAIIEKWKATIAEAGGYENIREELKEILAATIDPEITNRIKYSAVLNKHIDGLREIGKALNIKARTNVEIAQETMATVSQTAREALAEITKIVNSAAYKAIKEKLQTFTAIIEQSRLEYAALAESGEELEQLIPFLQLEIEAAQDDPALAGCTLNDLLLYGLDDDLQPTESKYKTLIEQARQRLEEYKTTKETIEEIEQAAEELPRLRYKRTDQIKATTDKLTNLFYSYNAPGPNSVEMTGQRSMLSYEDKKSKKEITLFYDYTYNDEILNKYGLSKKFDAYDWLVMTIVDNLSAAGNDTVSLTKIFSEMGGKGSPTSDQLEPIYHSLLKGMTTIITIDDAEVQKAWGNETYHEIVSPVIPVIMTPKRFVANGKIVDGLVKIGVSPFMRVADPIGHVTAWEKRILQLYTGRKTARYYKVMRFLMIQIAFMRTGNRSHKILYSSLYRDTESKTSRDQQLTLEMMYRLLNEVFIPAEYISKYKETDKDDPHPGVILTLNKKRLSDGAVKKLENNGTKRQPKKKK